MGLDFKQDKEQDVEMSKLENYIENVNVNTTYKVYVS